MKKITLLIMAFVLLAGFTKAQEEELTSKNGVPILPAQGDFAIGIDATPLIDLAGNLIKINSGSTFNDPSSFGFVNNTNTLYGKYYTSSNTAFRGKIRIGYHNETQKNYVYNDSYDGDPGDYDPANDDVLDKKTTSYTMIMIGGGIEKRRGYGRVQAFYGGEGLITIRNGTPLNPNESYEYGNDISKDNTAATTTQNFNTGNTSQVSTRTLENSQGGIFGIGARAFIGVEYFIAPKLAVGGEFGWGFNYEMQNKSTTETETWNSADDEV